jgi:hypothetical protein
MPTPSGRSVFITADAAPRAAGGWRGVVDHRPASLSVAWSRGRKKLVCPKVWPGVATGTGRPGRFSRSWCGVCGRFHRHPGTRTQEISERDDSRGPTAATRYGRSLTPELLVGRARNNGNSR